MSARRSSSPPTAPGRATSPLPNNPSPICNRRFCSELVPVKDNYLMLEEELKFDVDEDFTLPAIAGMRSKGRKRLLATYFDTADLRLARSGATLRHRVGDLQPWTVKLDSGVPGARHEISMTGPRVKPPADLVWL